MYGRATPLSLSHLWIKGAMNMRRYDYSKNSKGKTLMKKLLTAALAVLMAVAMSLSAFAEDTAAVTSLETGNAAGDRTFEITGNYTASSGVTVSVDITWEAMNFSYTAGDVEYSPELHKTTTGKGTWSTEPKSVTVKNHSNIGITVSFSFKGVGGVEGTFTKTSLTLESADADQYRTATSGVYPAPTDSTAFSIKEDSSAISETGKVGTVTVKLAKNP